MKTLETERLILREFNHTDLDDFYEYAKSQNVGPSAGWPPHDSKETSEKILKEFIEKDEVWALVLKQNNKLIGSLGFHSDCTRTAQDVKMLGYVLSEDYWGQGLIPEACKAALAFAFSDLNVQMVSVHHYPFNQKSRRVIEKCGFTYEGTLRHASKIYDGSVYDIACYSMTKEEWQNNHLMKEV